MSSSVRFLYLPIPRRYATRHGLSEKYVKRRLERSGWTVWRGALLNVLKRVEVYPNVRKKYELLVALLCEYHPGTLEEMQYLCHVHHGMPDFLSFRRGEFKFVECKLGHEQLNPGQKKCIPKLQKLGIPVEVHKVVDPCTKLREAWVDVENGEKEVVEKQLRIKMRY